MRILALDTSTGPASVAIVQNGSCIASCADGEAMRQSQRLVNATDSLVRANDGYDVLDAMAVTIGPGGFTGIRVALAAARGMALACDIPLLGITSLEAFAWQALHNQQHGVQALALVNAFRNQVYAQAFERIEGTMRPLCDAQAVDIETMAHFAAPYSGAICLGNVAADALNIANYIVCPAPEAQYVAEYAAILLEQDKADAIATHPAEACYIRPPDAKPQKPLLRV
jgi:tRNA threonylcarbamoyladenosine biosynthesis protein TsaB